MASVANSFINVMLDTNAKKLGFQDNSSTVRKAAEFLRVLDGRAAVTKALAINDVAKNILCLDLAASYTGVGFDKGLAIQLSGLQKSAYQNKLHNVEKILNVDKHSSIPELCVQLSCTVVIDTAVAILTQYFKSDTKIKDSSHPQYIAAAVFAACKYKGVKVDKSYLVCYSRLKQAQWKELSEEFDECVSAATGSPKTDLKKTDILCCLGKKAKDECDESKYKQTQEQQQSDRKIEDYEVWKLRILREARAC